MNITPNTIYWILQLDQIHEAIVGVILFVVLALVGLFFSEISVEAISNVFSQT